MSRQSLNLREIDASDVVVMLFELTHPDVDVPILISTDNADEISLKPYLRGTRSTFASPNGKPRNFLFTAAEAVLPDEEDESALAASIVVEVLDSDIVSLLTGTIVPAKCKVAVVQASSPNVIEVAYTGLQLVGAQGNYGTVSLQLSMKPMLDEPVPHVRFSQERFPGLFR